VLLFETKDPHAENTLKEFNICVSYLLAIWLGINDRKFKSSKLLCHVHWQMVTDVSEEHTSSILRDYQLLVC
jgi:hypothetical protein